MSLCVFIYIVYTCSCIPQWTPWMSGSVRTVTAKLLMAIAKIMGRKGTTLSRAPNNRNWCRKFAIKPAVQSRGPAISQKKSQSPTYSVLLKKRTEGLCKRPFEGQSTIGSLLGETHHPTRTKAEKLHQSLCKIWSGPCLPGMNSTWSLCIYRLIKDYSQFTNILVISYWSLLINEMGL